MNHVKSFHTLHVFIQWQWHTNITDFDAFKVALDDNIAWLHVSMQKPFLIMQVLKKNNNKTVVGALDYTIITFDYGKSSKGLFTQGW